MNGLEVARRLRQNETTKSIRILAMSGSPMDKRNWLQAGCDDFILKPFSISTLLARLSVDSVAQSHLSDRAARDSVAAFWRDVG